MKLVVLAWALALSACASMPARLAIPTTAAPSTVTGYLVKPKGDGPFPAVILLHGCSGLGLATTQKATWTLLHDWAQWYAEHGAAALILDSFDTRAVTSVCGTQGSPGPLERAHDAYAALAHLAALGFVDGRRVVLQGLSHGGSTVLAAMDGERFADRRLRFAGGIAYYPWCGGARADRFYAPVLILIGDKDDWTPARPCTPLPDMARRAGRRVELTVYPDAYHSFDFPGPRRTNDLGKVLEFNAAATRDATQRVERFAKDVLGGFAR